MIAKDFILESYYELKMNLQNKADSKFWEDRELFLKLARAYRQIQNDLPCFVSNESIDIKEGKSLYYLKHNCIKASYCFIDGRKYHLQEKDEINNNQKSNFYNIQGRELLISHLPKEARANVTYFYQKELSNENDYLTLPLEYEEALRLLYFSYVFEKSPKALQDRDLSIHYLKRYEIKKEELKRKKTKQKFVNFSYQRI